MADTGWQFVGTGANDASYGSQAWSNPGNITADDGSSADQEPLSSPSATNYLKGTNVGLSIPTGNTIDGIEVRAELSVAEDPFIDVDRVRLVDEAGAIGTTDRSGSETLTTSPVVYPFGGASDLWGDTWGETDVEDIDFGFVVALVATGDAGGALCDYFQVKVYHSAASAGLVEREFPRGLNRGLARGKF